ncbi:MAG: glycosyltransferase family protein [Minisyncoccota bacterium]
MQKFIFKNSYAIFTTNWQKKIFEKAYFLKSNGVFVIENYYGKKVGIFEPKDKNFVVAARSVKFKNLEFLQMIFNELISDGKDLKLEIVSDIDYEKTLEKIRGAYASILISISDISPNFILDTIRLNKPFIMTKETGLFDRLDGVGIFVDPYNKEEIKRGILSLLDKKDYQEYVERVKNFNFIHSWSEIASEFIDIYKKSS